MCVCVCRHMSMCLYVIAFKSFKEFACVKWFTYLWHVRASNSNVYVWVCVYIYMRVSVCVCSCAYMAFFS